MVKIQVVQHYFILNHPSRNLALENSGDATQITLGMLNYLLLLHENLKKLLKNCKGA
jgi:hypothetical protein